jgi:sugar diacid utilization regulator
MATEHAPDWLDEIARQAAGDAGDLSTGLLGDFLRTVLAAVEVGQPIPPRRLTRYRGLGAAAARDGVALRALLDLYLSAAWRLWRSLPPVVAAADAGAVVRAGDVMLHAVDDVVAVLAEGYQLARRELVRGQESARREFIDDLLAGTSDVAEVLHRATGFGLDLSGPYAVAVVRAKAPFIDTAPIISVLDHAVQGSKGDAPALLATKDGRVVIVFAAPDRDAIGQVRDRMVPVLDRGGSATDGRRATRSSSPGVGLPPGTWRLAVGRPATGAHGVARSYREALDALEVADRLGLPAAVADAHDLLVYQVLLRDRAGLNELVVSALSPLATARGGAGPLLDTLAAYFASGGNTAHTARSLHLSVRAVTYRLERVRALTGYDPGEPADRFTLQIATMGARLLGWPPS